MRAAFCVLSALLAASQVSLTHSARPAEFDFEIPRQSLLEAMLAFSAQSGLQVGFSPEATADQSISIGPLRGVHTADAALARLLQPHGLAHEWVNERTIYIDARRTQRARESALRTRLAAQQAIERAMRTASRDDMESILVLGARLSSLETEFRSVAVLDERRIASYGVANAAELAKRLTQAPFVRSDGFRVTGEQYIDLRGFGPGATLILINGRRVAGSATSFDTGGFDANTIPLTAVKRVEVLLDAPSVATGADAIGGVVNFVLKDEMAAPIAEVRYGGAAGGARERRFSLGMGGSRARLRGAATFDVFQRDDLFGAQRRLTADQDYRRYGGDDYRALQASPGNIASIAGENLPGLNSHHAGVPAGSSGANLTPEDFAATAGQLNRESLTRFRSIIPETMRSSLVATGELPMSRDILAFGEFLGTHRTGELTIGPPVLDGAHTPASNAFNPFGEAVRTDALLEGMDARTAIVAADLIRAVAGVRGHWRRWTLEASTSWSRERAEVSRENELDPARVAQTLASSDADAALNVFRHGPAGDASLLASLVAAPGTQQYSSDVAQGHAHLQGPLLELPAGEMSLAIGGEWRREKLSNDALPSSPERTVSAAFAEIKALVIDSRMQVPAIRRLALSLGIRGEDDSEIGAHVTPRYALVWRPLADLALRASYSRPHRAPSLFELHAPRTSLPIAMQDLRRNGEIASVVVTTGGNPGLETSAGRSWTAELELTPRALPDLRFLARYWETSIDGLIAPLPASLLVGHEHMFPARIARASPAAQDIEAGLPGALTSVDISPGNFGRSQASGVDVSVSFAFDTRAGRLTPELAATWNKEFSTQAAPVMPHEERPGVASELGTIPEWRAIAGLEWRRGPLAVFSAAQFVSAYDDAVLGARTGRRISSQALVDVQASLMLDSLSLSSRLMRGAKLAAGVMNLFDAEPRFSAVGRDAGYDPSQADVRQRFWYLRLAKEF